MRGPHPPAPSPVRGRGGDTSRLRATLRLPKPSEAVRESARRLRVDSTRSEEILWAALRHGQLDGRKFGRLPAGGTAKTPEEAKRLAAEIAAPVALKSQVLSGGRMKAGGVKFADTPEEAERAAEEILKLPIRDQLPVCVSVEAKGAVAKEYYLGVTYEALDKL